MATGNNELVKLIMEKLERDKAAIKKSIETSVFSTLCNGVGAVKTHYDPVAGQMVTNAGPGYVVPQPVDLNAMTEFNVVPNMTDQERSRLDEAERIVTIVNQYQSTISGLPDVPVTDEMIEAGNAAWLNGHLKDNLADMYRAMHALAPEKPRAINPSPHGIPVAAENLMTPEMIKAGVQELAVSRSAPISDHYWAQRVYCAMSAVAPIELISTGERIWHARALAAEGERDEAYGYLRRIFEHVAPQCTPLDDLMGICTQVDNALAGARMSEEQRLKERNNALEVAIAECEKYNAACRDNTLLRAELAAAHDLLAQRPAAFTDPDKKPKHDPFRDFPTDRRMIGR